MSEAANSEALPAAARTLRITVIGHSHIAALMQGSREWLKTNPSIKFNFIQLTAAEYRPPLHAGALNPLIDLAIAESRPHAILSCVGGNEHNVLGLLNHPVAFDFVLSEQPNLPLDETADVVPTRIVESWIRDRLEKNTFAILKALCRSVDVPVFHLESPPPLPSDEFIRKVPEAAFQERIDELGVAPAMLRYKLWRLRSTLVRTFVAGLDISFVPVPKEMQDENGMLIEAAWHNATHANAVFGEQALQHAMAQIRKTIA